jgi:acyl-CoA thioesterase-1
MHRRLFFFATISCFHAVTLQAAESAAPSVAAKSILVSNLEQGKPQTVVTYGTSLTAGGAWVKQLEAVLNQRFPGLATVINSGDGGKWSGWGLEHLDERVIQKKPDTVFIEFSINDAYAAYSPTTPVEKARANLEQMIDRILTANPKCEIVLMVMNPPVGEHLDVRQNILAYNQVYRDVAQKRGLRLIDHYPQWEKLLNEDRKTFDLYVSDGIHPDPKGCEQVIMPTMLKMLGLTSSETEK